MQQLCQACITYLRVIGNSTNCLFINKKLNATFRPLINFLIAHELISTFITLNNSPHCIRTNFHFGTFPANSSSSKSCLISIPSSSNRIPTNATRLEINLQLLQTFFQRMSDTNHYFIFVLCYFYEKYLSSWWCIKVGLNCLF